jgi:hypothetical protein
MPPGILQHLRELCHAQIVFALALEVPVVDGQPCTPDFKFGYERHSAALTRLEYVPVRKEPTWTSILRLPAEAENARGAELAPR